MSKVVVLIISHKEFLTDYEIISLKRCYEVLFSYDIRLIVPENLNVSHYRKYLPNPTFDFIDPIWQSTYANFNKLKIASFLYKRYSCFEYILFYEPDAYVFSNELDFWCNKGYDYIGAPWFTNCKSYESGNQLWRIGNGGFSLRKIQSHLHLLRNLKFIEFVYSYPDFSIKGHIANIDRLYEQFNTVISKEKSHFEENFVGNEDGFWSLYSKDLIDEFINSNKTKLAWVFKKAIIKQFNVPTPMEAVGFSFEQSPRYLFELNQNKLPFGCHAWHKYDILFWKNHIQFNV